MRYVKEEERRSEGVDQENNLLKQHGCQNKSDIQEEKHTNQTHEQTIEHNTTSTLQNTTQHTNISQLSASSSLVEQQHDEHDQTVCPKASNEAHLSSMLLLLPTSFHSERG